MSKTTYTIPKTQGRVSHSIDFAGYIYPQFLTSDNTTNIVANSGASSSVATPVLNTYTNAFSSLIATGNQGLHIGGITSFNRSMQRSFNEQHILGNYEATQIIPGKVQVQTLNMNKVVFYNDDNWLDTVLQVNDEGSIKQIAPLMIIENRKKPNGDYHSLIHLDCWFMSDAIKYDLEGGTLVVRQLSMKCARTFNGLQDAAYAMVTTVNNIQAANNILPSVNYGGTIL